MKRRIEKDWVDAYFEHGVDIDNRRVWIVGEITEDSILTAVKGLYLMDTIDPKEPCEMFISSIGGDVTETHALYDIINTISCPVWSFAFGKCMSAAPLLLAAGEKGHRWVAPHAEFMLHDYSIELDGKGLDIKAHLQQTERVNEENLRLLTKHSTKSYRFWKALCQRKTDVYFTAEQAIQWGLADSVWNERDNN